MSTPSVSVVIPVYKAEKYIDRCLESLARQTLDGVEYIFVNDASPDNSIDKVHSFFKAAPLKNSTYRVVDNPGNRGVGFARQNGLDHAQGKYVIHVDPDDWTEPGYLKKMYEQAEAAHADIVFCDIFIEYSDRTVESTQCPGTTDAREIIDSLCHGRILGSCWNKLVRRDYIKDCNAVFIPGINVCEDVTFFLQLLRNNPRIAQVGQQLYHYDRFTNSNSIQRHLLPDHLDQDNRLIETVGAILSDSRFRSSADAFRSSALFHIFEISPYSGAEFRRRYRHLWPAVAGNTKFSLPKKAILWLACHGLYRPARAIYRTLKKA